VGDATIVTTEQESTRKRLLTVKEVAWLLDCSPRSVYRLADAGRMPSPVRVGRLVRWRWGEIESWIKADCPAVRSVGARR
jgi:excisionase family DNA binding protein